MKILNVLLVSVFFSSFVYADENLQYTDAQKNSFMAGLRGSLSNQCVDDFSAKAAMNKHAISEQEKKTVLQGCLCVVDKSIEKAGGEDFIFSNNQNTVVQKLIGIMSDKNQMMPFIKECVPKKPTTTN